MSRLLLILVLAIALAGCSSKRGTIAELRQVEIVIEDEGGEASVDKAIESYQQFLETTDETQMTPEAIRRLADLKVEKEYGLLGEQTAPEADRVAPSPPSAKQGSSATASMQPDRGGPALPDKAADDTDPADRATVTDSHPAAVDLDQVGAGEAIALYRKLLDDYPHYQRNDQVLYQLSRAYEEQGQIEEAIQVMNRLVTEFPDAPHLDQIQFRRAEYFFARRKYGAAEEAYRSVVTFGEESDYYQLAFYKLGWSLYKQDAYLDAIHQFLALLDYKVANNFDFENFSDDQEEKRVDDTLRIISQSFSNLGGVTAVVDYFSNHGSKRYEDVIYASLAEYYFSKQRYNDAVTTYTTFVERNSYHRQAPIFYQRVIAINEKSGFPSLVIKAKKFYAQNYGFGTDYWKYFNPDERPKVVAGLRVNLVDLANHYHALYQNERLVKDKPDNLEEALHWYREFLSSFPMLEETPGINYQLAELLLENNSYAEAAREYEKVAFEYPVFAKADQAGHAAVYAYRQHLQQADEEERMQIKQDVIRVSLKFAEFYPEHEKAAAILGAAIDNLYALKDFKTALSEGQKLVRNFPQAAADIRRSAWLVVAHSSYELEKYGVAEKAYSRVLQMLPEGDPVRAGLVDNLVASIYKQGEADNRRQNYKKAAEHFLRVAVVAPQSKLRPTAEYDGAVALIKVEEWQGAAKVLTGFRENFPEHELQHEVTKKLAYVYQQDSEFAKAAVEFERVEAESKDPALRQEALLTAAELYEKIDDLDRAAIVYRRYVKSFPEPFAVNIEVRNRLASILKKLGRQDQYLGELQQIVNREAAGSGSEQTDQSRSTAARAALILAKRAYDDFISVRLVEPFEKNLQRKQELMKKATDYYAKIFDYEIGDFIAEATYYLAEIYADFSTALIRSERPEGLTALEMEQYELALEEQAYPFEEKAIEMHQSNVALIPDGIYNDWIVKSLARLADFMPARYDKQEVANRAIAPFSAFRFENRFLAATGRDEAGGTTKDTDGKPGGGKE